MQLSNDVNFHKVVEMQSISIEDIFEIMAFLKKLELSKREKARKLDALLNIRISSYQDGYANGLRMAYNLIHKKLVRDLFPVISHSRNIENSAV